MFPNVYGESDYPEIDADKTLNYKDVLIALKSIGGGLPTLQEIIYGVGQGTGQRYDDHYLWTQTKGPGHLKRYVCKGDSSSGIDCKIVSESDLYRTQAYFDINKQNMPVFYDNNSRIRTQTVKSDSSWWVT